MRSRFRASTVVYAARYAPTADALGSMQPGYAAARQALRGTLIERERQSARDTRLVTTLCFSLSLLVTILLI